MVYNGGSGTITELPGVGQGFFNDQNPRTLFDLGSALLQPPTFVGDSGLGYAVTAEGNLVRFNLADQNGGAAVVYSGQQVLAAQALGTGQVVVALADGDVTLLSPQAGGLAVTSTFVAQTGLPASPSAIDVVSKAGGQFNVLVSSAGSDTIFVFDPAAASGAPGGAVVSNPALPALNSVEPPTPAALSQSFSLTTGAVASSASATSSSSSASASTSSTSSSASVTAATTIGLSLGTFSSLGNRSTGGTGGTVLVPVEGNTYLSVPILDFGPGNDQEAGAGEGRMPGLSARYPFGDTSPLTRFVIGLDEALRGYRSSDEEPFSPGLGPFRDPWKEDLFHQHSPVAPPAAAGSDGGDRMEADPLDDLQSGLRRSNTDCWDDGWAAHAIPALRSALAGRLFTVSCSPRSFCPGFQPRHRRDENHHVPLWRRGFDPSAAQRPDSSRATINRGCGRAPVSFAAHGAGTRNR